MTARIDRVTFPGSQGHELAARLDLPAGPPRAFALFAHCFTCGKDLRSAGRLATALTEAGFGVVRFDFTGLGQSEGEFSNTDFTSNTADLLAAVDWMRANQQAPQLLVGHSLGGAAVLQVAAEIDEVRAVATIGAPSDTDHLSGLFAGSVDQIANEGEACVSIAGRDFTIRQEFLDDLAEHRVTDRVAQMRRALLVLHSPTDNIVGVDHARRLFDAAQHPKSFVSLGGADHMLTRPEDAAYAAQMIAAFAILFIFTLLAGAGLNMTLSAFVEATGLSGTDRTLGMVFGLLRGTIIVLALLILAPGLIPVEEDPWWQESALIPHFLAFEGHAREAAEGIQEFFADLF